jgi:phosphohistidine phosphatase
MKRLTVVRHAKAEDRMTFRGSDFDRPLAPKGRKQMKALTPLFAGLGTVPDWLLSSPAQRTKETAELLARRIKFGREISYDLRIYEAAGQILLDVLREQPKTADHLVLVGHNPGMEWLVSGLTCGDENRLGVRMATGSLVHLELDIAHWHQCRWGCGVMTLFCPPKYLMS